MILRLLRSRFFATIAITIAVASILTAAEIFATVLTDALDLSLQNILYHEVANSVPVHPQITVVEIDDETLRSLGQWDRKGRDYMATAISHLSASGAATIGIDVLYSET